MESDDWCWGELLHAVEGWQERERFRAKQDSEIALRQASLTAGVLCGKKPPEVWEVFPFWTEEEVQALRVEKYRRIMERYAAQGVRKHSE